MASHRTLACPARLLLSSASLVLLSSHILKASQVSQDAPRSATLMASHRTLACPARLLVCTLLPHSSHSLKPTHILIKLDTDQ